MPQRAILIVDHKNNVFFAPKTQLPRKPSHSKEIFVFFFTFFPTPNMGCPSFYRAQMALWLPR